MFGNLFSKNEEENTQQMQQPGTIPVQDNTGVMQDSQQQSPQQNAYPNNNPMMQQPNSIDPGQTATPQTPQTPPTQVPAIPVQEPSVGTSTSQQPDSLTSQSSQVQQPAVPSVAEPTAPGQTVGYQVNSQGPISPIMDPSVRENVSALSHLDPRATQVLSHATQEARRIQQALIEPPQILLGLLFDGEIFRLLEQFSINVTKISDDIKKNEMQGSFTGQPTLSNDAKDIFDKAYDQSKNRGASFIAPEDLLVVLFDAASTSAVLTTGGVSKEKVEEKLSKTAEYSTGKRSVLEKYGLDLTEQARQGLLDPITGRDKEIERLIHILLRRTKNNPIIIGEAGVGKTAIVEALAQRIVDGNVPAEFKDKKIIQLEVSSLVAGASHRGEFEERLRGVIKEVQLAEGKIILFIDEVHTLVGAGETEGALDASNIIKPFLARGQLQMIGTTTTSEYRKYFEKDKAFERRFQPILVEEPSIEVAIDMMNIVKDKYEKFHSVIISPEAIEASVKLSKKYIGERFLPDKAVDLLDEASAEVKLEHAQNKREDNTVKKSDIEKVVSNWTGIPITRLTEDESQKLLKLEDLIHEKLIDQEQAVATVAEAVRRGRIGLASANRPIASFIFLGPTGVGKTELAKTLAMILFGREDAMVRLDMSEYMEKHEVAKLIGAPPGYVGYEEGGQLTEAVRTKPYSIVLLDEVEKAHPDVFNILLQLLEDGRLTDNKGNTISFKNTIVIATSNLGSSLIQKQLGEAAHKKEEDRKENDNSKNQAQDIQQADPKNTESTNSKQESEGQKEQAAEEKTFKELTKTLMEELHKFFKPELLNRFDGLVVFKPLSQKDMSSIAKLAIGNTKKLLQEQGYGLEISDNAIAQLAKEGYDPAYGARPLRRIIQTAIENPISMDIIGKKFVPQDIILIDFDEQNKKYTFIKKTPPPPVPDSAAAPEQPTNPQSPSVPAHQTQNLQSVQEQVSSDPQNGQNQVSTQASAQGNATQSLPQAEDLMFPKSPETTQDTTQASPSQASNGNAAVPTNGYFQTPQPASQIPPAPNNTTSDGQMMQPQQT